MSGFGDSIRHNLRSLTRFAGRDRRSQFWPYAGTVVVLSMVGDWIVSVPIMATSISSVQRAEATRSMSDFGFPPYLFLLVTTAWFLIVVGLLAAAVVRRLHDRNMRGIWGLLPIPFVLIGLTGMAFLMHSFSTGSAPDMRWFFALFFNNMIYLVTLVFLIIHLALKGTAGANRYGEEPPA